MSAEPTFAEFVRRIRAGDDQAAAELVKRYEPAIRMEVRMRLSDGRLRRVFDSSDICQSVLASFFVRAALGQYDLEKPEQLIKLLIGMTRNKVAFQARKQRAQRRDHRRNVAADLGEADAAGTIPSPSRYIIAKELLGEFRQRLSIEERQLADLRAQGVEWSEIAAQVGGTAQGRRKQLSRGLDRVAHDLGLDEEATR
jgi:RNA polymerase sigma-70 factor (ECF subfamily)